MRVVFGRCSLDLMRVLLTGLNLFTSRLIDWKVKLLRCGFDHLGHGGVVAVPRNAGSRRSGNLMGTAALIRSLLDLGFWQQ